MRSRLLAPPTRGAGWIIGRGLSQRCSTDPTPSLRHRLPRPWDFIHFMVLMAKLR